MQESYETAYRQAIENLETGNLQQAFAELNSILRYPGHQMLEQKWQEALELFARIGREIAGDEFANKVLAVTSDSENAETLYYLGYELIEQGLPEIAATILIRANEIVPGNETILSELVCALEKIGENEEACHLLRSQPQLLSESFICSYLLAFNSIMSGNLEQPRQLLPQLQQYRDPDCQYMSDRIAQMLQRADAASNVSTLDSQDLRGWHFVITGAILLHLSPYGFDDGMNGRYAYIHDDYYLVREGIERLFAVLDRWNFSIPRIFVLPDRNSEILARAVAKIRPCPLEPWSEDKIDSPGLIVAYDLSYLNIEILEALRYHHPGQILWSHASCWTTEPPFAADLTTYFYQVNTPPWEEGINIENTPPAPTPTSIEDAVNRIVEAQLAPEALNDLSNLIALATAVQAVASVFKQNETRLRQWDCSPVKSSYFL